ncbi:PREDICTED: stearoyl-CoA desaturase 5-like [Rhagoletis zephyria]|uniref:stearoyl-CoA desaturase 5-like n=1 Tax=Rhagoletis zephyria TaxID=28612 RepID=UPI0008119010|nr:PREDICTED: stearoyl-CoA desaturase 5-like [Rhagoletis zephyria]XP_017482959.1 PREDICTED: stearoyl-CoA desaturase 5-like [Rhagoletis zephyria]
MAPNLIGSTFLIAETAITNNNNDANNNKQATLAKSTCKTATSNNDRVPNQGESAAAISRQNSAKPVAQTQNKADTATQKPYKMEIVWFNVFLFVLLHSSALYGVWLIWAENAYLEFVIGYFYAILGGLGITAGVHRLWSHRAYKAKLPLRIFLMLCQSLAFQNSIYEWCRDHRVHHKFTDTNADPHNSGRGFFFAHMGWLMCKKHSDVRERGKCIDMSDILADPVVQFQRKYYFVVMPICCFVLPALFPYFVLGSSLQVCFFVCSMLRYALSLHGTWLVNSAAHFYGMRPYEKNISSVDSKFVSIIAFGEGWHNYHHVFPWDYKAGELGAYKHNWTTAFLDLMARIGQAYDLKSVSQELILKRLQRTGDGSHYSLHDLNNNNVNINQLVSKLDHEKEDTMIWGWDDTDISSEDRKGALYENKEE